MEKIMRMRTYSQFKSLFLLRFKLPLSMQPSDCIKVCIQDVEVRDLAEVLHLSLSKHKIRQSCARSKEHQTAPLDDVNGQQCASKLRSLKRFYKTNNDHNSKSGNGRRRWQHFQIMEVILGKKVWCDLIAVASFPDLSQTSITNDSVGGSDR
ncbi:hypothetical protein PV328_001180 [Microctonus aethiopoides]|uniref:Uncharacterized protein n=1 Tax=Microctonus aethiopoides TaxID=144406 RepID=A0AA39KXD1_9HYME|nr:hypothetical protein PV328_001180 [Microctonus aethiopoides]